MASLRYNHKLRTRVNKFRTLSSNGITGRLKEDNGLFPIPTSIPFPTPTPLPIFLNTIIAENQLITIDGSLIQAIP
jgi:hypothetical protein